mgnify:CR=1 FL=1
MRIKRGSVLLIAGLVASLVGCRADVAVDVRGLEGGPNVTWGPRYGELAVFYATDRAIESEEDGDVRYGPRRGRLSRGVCTVTIPPGHRVGELALYPPDDPGRYIVARRTTRMNPDTFNAELRAALSRPTADGRPRGILVYLHGYNNSFVDVTRRAGQIAYDLGIDLVPVVYSWPSEAHPAKYTVDLNNARWSQPQIVSFLRDLRLLAGDRPIHVLAHSMGAGLAGQVMLDLDRLRDPTDGPIVDQLILAAPDIDRDIFARDLAGPMLRQSRRVTLYTASQDRAMQVSSFLFGDYARAGDGEKEVLLIPGMDTVDVSMVNQTIIGHLYYGDSREVLDDMFLVIRHDLPPTGRRLLSRGEAEGRYWVLRP